MSWRTELADILDRLGTQAGRLDIAPFTFRNLDELIFQLRKPSEIGWQPIETAPTDWTPILIAYNSGEIELEKDTTGYTWRPYDGNNQVHLGISTPTHWMAVPELPQ